MGRNTCRYVLRLKAVEAGRCTYLHVLHLRLSRLVSAHLGLFQVCFDTCMYIGLFSLFWVFICMFCVPLLLLVIDSLFFKIINFDLILTDNNHNCKIMFYSFCSDCLKNEGSFLGDFLGLNFQSDFLKKF